MSAWARRHRAPDRHDGRPPHRPVPTRRPDAGTPTWSWSVVVDGRVPVRAWNGTSGKWYRATLAQRAGTITADGATHDVAFTAVDDPDLGTRIDAAYEEKYAGSPYLPPMVAAGPRAATVEITPRDPA